MDAGHVQARRGPSVAGDGTVRFLAEAAVFGLPVHRIMYSRDPLERELLREALTEAVKVVDDLHTNLARKIVHEYAEAKKKGDKKSK